MRKIYIIRHADWDLKEDNLVATGIEKSKLLSQTLPKFYKSFSSDFVRTQKTAEILSKYEPITDPRAGILYMTEEQNKKIARLRKTNKLGVVGAIFETPELLGPLEKAGRKLLALIKEVINEMPSDSNALIVTHDGTMVAAEKILNNESFESAQKTYLELEGFVIDENLHMTGF